MGVLAGYMVVLRAPGPADTSVNGDSMNDFTSEPRPPSNSDVSETVLDELYVAMERYLQASEPDVAHAARLKQAVTAAFSHGAISETHAAYLIRRFGLESA